MAKCGTCFGAPSSDNPIMALVTGYVVWVIESIFHVPFFYNTKPPVGVPLHQFLMQGCHLSLKEKAPRYLYRSVWVDREGQMTTQWPIPIDCIATIIPSA